MEPLSGLDAGFLFLETPEMPMHVGTLQVFAWPEAGRRRFVSALRAHVAARLPDAPALRRRVWSMPLNLANPVWVETAPDLKLHIVETRLPRGAGWPELEAAVGRLHAERLDRDRPLWRMHVIEGLPPGPDGTRRVALYAQVHQAAAGGSAVRALAAALFDPPSRAGRRRRRADPEPGPGPTELLREALAQEATQLRALVRELPSTVGAVRALVERVVGGGYADPADGSRARGARGPLSALAPRSPFNVSVGATRAFGALSLPAAPLQAIAEARGVAVEDVLGALCGGALRRYLVQQRALPRGSLIAAVPLSSPDGARVSLGLVSLGTHLTDPWRRVAHVAAARARAASLAARARHRFPTDLPSLGVPWLLETAASLYGRVRVAERVPSLANVVLSMAQGSGSIGRMLAGARLEADFPASALVHGLALNIALHRHADNVDIGLVGDGAAVPDVGRLADALRAAADEFVARHADDRAVDAAADGLTALARRGIEQVVGGAAGLARRTARGVVDGAADAARRTTRSVVEGVVDAALGRPRKPAARRGR